MSNKTHLAKNHCNYCNKPFYVEIHRINTAKSCSNECKKLSKPQKVEKICIVCKEPFLVHQCYIENKFCCSKQCQNFSQRMTVNKFFALINVKKIAEEYDKTSCWEWLSNKDEDLYGYLTINYTGMRAHRVMYELWYGEFDSELKVCHTCDNPPCCNPYHLFLGTNLDNIADRVKKGRSSRRGKRLSIELKQEILSLKGTMKIRDISEKTNVSVRTIQIIFGYK